MTKRKQNPTIQIPNERLLQLKQLSQTFGGISASATLGRLFQLAREQGLVGHDIPDIQINAFSDGVAIGFNGVPPSKFPTKAASVLAQTIRDYAEASNATTRLIDFDNDFGIRRKGNGVILTIPATNGVEKTLSCDLALDLADLIEREIAIRKVQTA